MTFSRSLLSFIILNDRAEEDNEGPEPIDLLAGDRPMGGLRGVL